MNSIILNNIDSSTIQGLLISKLPPISKPLMRTMVEEIDGRDGDIITKLGYSAYDREVEVGLHGSFDLDAIIRYFNSEGTVVFSNEPDKTYQYEIINQIDFEKLIRYRTATVTFHCQPFKHKLNEPEIGEDELFETLSGDIVSFDGVENGVVKSLIADIDAVQDLHGYDHPWVGGAGANVFQLADITTIKSINTVGSWSGNTYSIGGVTFAVQTDDSGNIIGFNINGTATFTINFYIAPTNTPATIPVGRYTFSSGTTGSSSTTSRIYWEWYNTSTSAWVGNANDSFTTSQDTDKVQNARIQVFNGATISNKVYKPMLNAGQTALPFAPYSNICPISGWDEVNVNVRGKNLFGLKLADYADAISYGLSSYKSISVPNGVYTISTNAPTGYIWGGDKIDSGVSYIRVYSGNPHTITVEAGLIFIGILTTDKATALSYNIQIERGSTATTYEPYNGQTYTTDLNDTRYGGTLDVTTGVLTITHWYVDLGDLTWQSNVTGTGTNRFYSSPYPATQISDTGRPNSICSAYKLLGSGKTYDGTEDGYTITATGQVYIFAKAFENSTTSQFKTGVAGVQLVYKLATPQVVQLTAQEVRTLLENNIWADTGGVEVTFPRVGNIINTGNIYSRPTITIYGSGVIDLYINDQQVLQIDLADTEYITINGEEMNAYRGSILANRRVTGDYDNLRFEVGSNTLSVAGNVTEVRVSNYVRWV